MRGYRTLIAGVVGIVAIMGALRVPAPVLGEHTESILADVLGLGAGQIGRLMDQGVVAQGIRPSRAA